MSIYPPFGYFSWHKQFCPEFSSSSHLQLYLTTHIKYRGLFCTQLYSSTVSKVSSTEYSFTWNQIFALLRVTNNLTCDIYVYWSACFVNTPLQYVDQNHKLIVHCIRRSALFISKSKWLFFTHTKNHPLILVFTSLYCDSFKLVLFQGSESQ